MADTTRRGTTACPRCHATGDTATPPGAAGPTAGASRGQVGRGALHPRAPVPRMPGIAPRGAAWPLPITERPAHRIEVAA